MFTLLAAVLLAAPAGPHGSALAPPAGFVADPELIPGGTDALALVAGAGDPARHLVAFSRGTQVPSATFTLSEVEAPLAIGPASKAALAAVVAQQLQQAVDHPFALERTVLSSHAGQARVEVWGHLAMATGPRTVGVAFFGGAHRYLVAVASIPAAQAPSLRPVIEAAFDRISLSDERAPGTGRRTAISVAVWGLAALCFLALRLRRRATRTSPPRT